MNNKICIISKLVNDYISGNLIDCLDLYLNIKDYIDCDYFIFIKAEELKIFNYKLKTTFKQSFANNILQHVKTYQYQIDFDKYDLFIYRYNYYKKNPSITNYKGILLNGWSVMYDIIYNKLDITNKFQRIISSPFIFNHTNSKTNIFRYFLKLSNIRLDNLIMDNKYHIFTKYSKYEHLKSNKAFNIHNYNKICYQRHLVNNTNFYMEMKGKLIFEFLYFGKQVHYSPVNKQFNDGLTDYLSLFGIDDNIEQDLYISKEEIFDKLVKFDEKDELLQFIKMC